MVPIPIRTAAHAVGSAVSRRVQFIHEARVDDIDADPAFAVDYRRCRPYTMTSISRMYALYQAVRYVVQNEIRGDFVECGVWRGGSAMLMASALRRLGDTDRGIYLYDTFDGMSEPTHRDVDLNDRPAVDLLESSPRNSHIWACASREDVEANMIGTGYPPDRVLTVQGRVEETIPTTAPDQIAILRLDTDWYESTMHEMEHLYPRLTNRGVIIIDDYGYWRGAREAVDEYLAKYRVPIFLNRIDFTGRVGIKVS